MSALALILKSQGYIVQGSDLAVNEYTKRLVQRGIKVFFGHKEKNAYNANVIVYTSAISQDNQELVYANKNNIKTLTRAELLEKVSYEYKNVIAISGAHGKTTTTAMISEVFIEAKLNPTAHVGGSIKSVNSNLVLGGNDYFITEACEYKDNFLHFKPTVGVVLNVEPEHLDYFKTFENLQASFDKFAQNCENLIAYQKVEINHKNKIIYGSNGYNARRIKKDSNGKYSFYCYYEDKKLFRVKLNIVGKHNLYNALATIAVCKFFNIKNSFIKASLKKFGGISRRFDIKSEKPFIVHDYAHHPSEISSVIEAVKTFKKGKIYVVFQPHTYTRTLHLMQDFLTAFDGVSEVCIIKTYSAREEYIAKGSAKELFNKLKKRICNIAYFHSFNACYNHLISKLHKKDTVLILGAGDIDKLADKFGAGK